MFFIRNNPTQIYLTYIKRRGIFIVIIIRKHRIGDHRRMAEGDNGVERGEDHAARYSLITKYY